jgi:hypothetical protein
MLKLITFYFICYHYIENSMVSALYVSGLKNLVSRYLT